MFQGLGLNMRVWGVGRILQKDLTKIWKKNTWRPRTFQRRILSEQDILQKRGPLSSDSFDKDSPLSSFARSLPCALLCPFCFFTSQHFKTTFKATALER
jgi:hypothetical protein